MTLRALALLMRSPTFVYTQNIRFNSKHFADADFARAR
jgi:hypothetical protein